MLPLRLAFSYSLIRGCFTIGDGNESVVDLSAHHLLVVRVGSVREKKKKTIEEGESKRGESGGGR